MNDNLAHLIEIASFKALQLALAGVKRRCATNTLNAV
jgi:hypothetical protein